MLAVLLLLPFILRTYDQTSRQRQRQPPQPEIPLNTSFLFVYRVILAQSASTRLIIHHKAGGGWPGPEPPDPPRSLTLVMLIDFRWRWAVHATASDIHDRVDDGVHLGRHRAEQRLHGQHAVSSSVAQRKRAHQHAGGTGRISTQLGGPARDSNGNPLHGSHSHPSHIHN